LHREKIWGLILLKLKLFHTYTIETHPIFRLHNQAYLHYTIYSAADFPSLYLAYVHTHIYLIINNYITIISKLLRILITSYVIRWFYTLDERSSFIHCLFDSVTDCISLFPDRLPLSFSFSICLPLQIGFNWDFAITVKGVPIPSLPPPR